MRAVGSSEPLDRSVGPPPGLEQEVTQWVAFNSLQFGRAGNYSRVTVVIGVSVTAVIVLTFFFSSFFRGGFFSYLFGSRFFSEDFFRNGDS